MNLDVCYEISRWIEDGSTWKSWLFTCKAFAAMNTREKVLQFAHGLSSLVKLLPKKDWDYDRVCCHVKLECIRSPPNGIKNWSGLSANPFFTLDSLEPNSLHPRCLTGFSRNSNVTVEFVSENRDLPWCFRSLSQIIPIEQMKENDDLPWSVRYIVDTSITVEFLRENREYVLRICPDEKLDRLENNLIAAWRWRDKRPFTFDQYRCYPNLPWDWRRLAPIAEFTSEEILSIDDRLFSGYFSANRAITVEIVKSHPEKNWNHWYLHLNPNVTIETIKENPDLTWNLSAFSDNPNVTMKVVKENLDLAWNWSSLSVNPSITWLDIYENPDLPWDFYAMSSRK